MGRKIINEVHIPAGHGRAVTVEKGQVVRLSNPEGGQACDAAFFNAHNYKEVFHPGVSVYYNFYQGIGNTRRLTKLYSKPPRSNLMLTVIDDPVGIHWAYMGSRCNKLIYKLRDNVDCPPHRSCQDNLAEAIEPYGLTGDDVPEVMQIWMDVYIDPETMMFVINPSPAKKGDYIEMRAEMDVLAAFSACPSDKVQTNHGKPNPLDIQVWEPS
ncbi:MAG: urea carboxylase-associated family protein [Chloroflexi bacterium]|nr:urea carboxylase-associated family protein [Chloroflexota bacterium]